MKFPIARPLKWFVLAALFVLVTGPILNLDASPALAQEAATEGLTLITKADVIQWMINIFLWSLLVMVGLMMWAGEVVVRGVKPEVEAKYKRYAGIIAMFFDEAVREDVLKKRNRIRIYIRICALSVVILALSAIFYKL